MTPLAVFILLFFIYSLVSRRMEPTIVTAPILFIVAGMLTAFVLPTILRAGVKLHFLLYLAEVGLVLLLFSDANRVALSALPGVRNLPVRLLTAGMLLTILFGAFARQAKRLTARGASPASPARFILAVEQLDLRQSLAVTFVSGFRSIG